MIDIVIATYNRFDRAVHLASQLVGIGDELINKVLLVDSTDDQVKKVGLAEKVVHICTTHKNQPIQRYIGFQHSKAEILLFLDDDMEIANESCITIIQESFKNEETTALAIHFVDKHSDTSLAAIPRSLVPQKANNLKKAINWFTGYPNLPTGFFGLCGVRGAQPKTGGKTSFVSGGAFAARRASMYQNFNFLLFDLYNKKLGKGEDAITGYTLSKVGTVHYDSTLLFYHNDQKDSAYSIDHYSFARRVAFSRKYLSLEKTRLDGGNRWYAVTHYHWYMLWRTSGLLVNSLASPTDSRKKLLSGTLKGWQLASKFSYSYKAEPTAMSENSN